MRKGKKILIGFMVFIMLLFGSFFLYVNDYYKADDEAYAYLNSDSSVNVVKVKDGYFFDGIGTKDAIIFYPGGKVAYEAYAPLLFQLSQQGFDCFLVKMPCNLAFLGKDKADEIIDQYTYDNWYIMGHSLGGAFSAVYTAENSDKIDGLCMLAAYPTSEIASSIKTMMVYGSNDCVVNQQKLEQGKAFLPKDYKEICILGGNHAMYGNYGEQKGDGNGDITWQEQQRQTVLAITSWINNE